MLAGSLSLRGDLVSAQDGGAFSGLDFPTLDITVTADGFGGVDTELEAGRYLITVTPEDGLESWGASFVQPPEELTGDQFILELQSASIVQTQDETESDSSPVADPLPAGAPLVAYEATFAGGAMGVADSSEPSQAVIDLTPGEWVLWAGDPAAVQSPLIFEATGEMPSDLAQPEAGIDVTLTDGSISFDGQLSAGNHVLRIAHEGEQPHHLQLSKAPDGVTEDEVEQALAVLASEGADAEAAPFDPETELTATLITADQSMGTVQWVPATLEAGTYVALCLFPAQEDSAPHALEGEFTIVTVE